MIIYSINLGSVVQRTTLLYIMSFQKVLFKKVKYSNTECIAVSVTGQSSNFQGMTFRLFSSVNVDNFVLINKLKDVRGVHQDPNCSYRGDQEEYPELSAVNHHRYELPIFSDLKLRNCNVLDCTVLYSGLYCNVNTLLYYTVDYSVMLSLLFSTSFIFIPLL